MIQHVHVCVCACVNRRRASHTHSICSQEMCTHTHTQHIRKAFASLSAVIVCTEFHNSMNLGSTSQWLLLLLLLVLLLLLRLFSSVFVLSVCVCALCRCFNGIYNAIFTTAAACTHAHNRSTYSHKRTHSSYARVCSLKHRSVYGRIGLVFSLSITCLAFYRHFHLIIGVAAWHGNVCVYACVGEYLCLSLLPPSLHAELVCASLVSVCCFFFNRIRLVTQLFLASGRTYV